METIVFFPATWNLAETTRTIQVAKACQQEFRISFAGYGGPFEHLIEADGFPSLYFKEQHIQEMLTNGHCRLQVTFRRLRDTGGKI